ncbi:MAG: hypothetical protein NVS9B15_24310 [Acidobacteriaceae bacterium]
MRNGVTYDRAWVGEMESSTPDVHVTFGTGTLPRENGFLGFSWATPDTRQSVDFRSLLANHGVDPVLQSLPVPSVAARLHQYLPQAVSIAASGHKDYAVVGLGGGAATYELYGKFSGKQFIPAFMHSPPPLSTAQRLQLSLPSAPKMTEEDTWATEYTLDVVQKVRPKLLMVNFPELDTWGHWYGPRSADVQRRILLNVDQRIGDIEATYKKLGIFDRTTFIVTADHSMMDSRPARNWKTVWTAVSEAGAKVVRTDTEGASLWLQDPRQAKAVADRLVAKRPQHVEAILYRSAPGLDYSYALASPASWLVNHHVVSALQDLVNTTAGRNGPDVWVLYREDYTVVPRNVSGSWKGTHGGPSWKVQHVPLIISGAGIRKGAHSEFPARAIDIAPTMERLLGLPSIRRDGVILADALLAPKKTETKAQTSVEAPLAADVLALKQQSAADVRSESPWHAPVPSVRCRLQSGKNTPVPVCVNNAADVTNG